MEYSECPCVVGVGETILSAFVVVLDFCIFVALMPYNYP